LQLPFPDALSQRLINMGNQSDLAVYIILLTGLKVLIFRYFGYRDILIRTPVNRLKVSIETLNDFVYIRSTPDTSLTFKDFLLEVKTSVTEAYDNQDYPFDRILEMLRGSSSTALSQSHLSTNIHCSMASIHDNPQVEETERQLFFFFQRENDRLNGELRFDPHLHDRDFVEQFARQYMQLLENAMTGVETKITDIAYLTEEDKDRLTHRFNDNKSAALPTEPLHRKIEKYAASPDISQRAAVACEGETLTYRQLNEQANRLAAMLLRSGVQNEHTVGILMERSLRMAVAILAIWKSGAAYIPIDPWDPHRRIVRILEDSSTSLVLAEAGSLPARLQELYNGTILLLDKEEEKIKAESPGNPGVNVDMSSLAYVIYTSGSTGEPKGAMVEHIGMMNHIEAKVKDLQLTAASVIAQNSPHTFDISVWQYFAALSGGGKTVIYSNEMVMESARFVSSLAEDNITILEVVPSYLSVILDQLAAQSVPLHLRYLLVTGEEVKPHLVRRWFELNPGIKVVNAYGPTEASDDITHHVMDHPPRRQRIPVGKPVLNTNIYIVDNHNQLCPVGVMGEIWVSGVGVGRGYLNNEEKTRQVFITDPFIDKPGVRLYKTGDLGCWLPDGSIDFFGRKDYQVKIRGFRIELGEIEKHLLTHPGVGKTVVIDREDNPGDKSLCAYYVTTPAAETPPDAAGLKEYLAQRLPDHMVPSHFVRLETIPLTPNGKINRKALPRPEVHHHTPITYIDEEQLNHLAAAEIKSDRKEMQEEFAAPEQPLPPGEREKVLYTFNDTRAAYPHDKTLHGLFEEQVEKSPGSIAAVFFDLQVTYRELNKRANQLAHRLLEKGVEPDSVVGIMVQRSMEMLVSVLGILKTGAAYLPIDPQFPSQRKEYILHDSGVKLLLSDIKRENIPGLAHGEIEVVHPGEESIYTGSGENPERKPSAPHRSPGDELAYVMYTSGSTGQPKGALLEHKNLVNLLDFQLREVPLGCKKILQYSTLSFDVSFHEIFSALLRGGVIYLLNMDMLKDLTALFRLADRCEIETVFFTPTMLKTIFSEPRFVELFPRKVKHISAGGEQLMVTDRFREYLEANSIHLYNYYGPSETHAATCLVLSPAGDIPALPTIGTPISNSRIYILDKQLKPVPIGTVGELYIAGECVGRGYLNNPLKTKERFLEDPFVPGERMYVTGDLSRWQAAGSIEFLGRIDNQVQIDGIRIEPGEIETHLLKHPDVDEAVVVVKEIKTGDKQLFAFLVSETSLTASTLKEYLGAGLPDFMVPTGFIRLQKMPLTPNGKIHRQLLETLEVEIDSGIRYAAPKTRNEKMIARIWEEVLGIDQIGTDDNFFDIGGNSILCIKVNSRLKDAFKRDIPVAAMFRYMTVSELAAYLAQDKKREEIANKDRSKETDRGKDRMKQTMRIMRRA
jgi:amino acid adenylation domain-containing protein